MELLIRALHNDALYIQQLPGLQLGTLNFSQQKWQLRPVPKMQLRVKSHLSSTVHLQYQQQSSSLAFKDGQSRASFIVCIPLNHKQTADFSLFPIIPHDNEEK